MENLQEYRIIQKDELVEKARQMNQEGFRLAQISATKKDQFDLLYSFEKDYKQINIRLEIDTAEEIESISGVYAYAFLYENELKDLFGVKIAHMNIDFKGNLYKTSIKTPFNNENEPVNP